MHWGLWFREIAQTCSHGPRRGESAFLWPSQFLAVSENYRRRRERLSFNGKSISFSSVGSTLTTTPECPG